MNRTAFVIASLLTAFALVLAGGLLARVPPPPSAAVAAADGGVDAAQRDAEWRQLLAEANARLQQANAAPVAAPAAAATSDIGGQGAAQVALLAAPGSRLLRAPELVVFEGVTAYEVTLDQGVVYVDAASGAMLYNGTAPAATSPSSDDDEDEHDDHDDHDEDDD